uniref:Uncharacterized protein n=1 Tax=Leersia perrieri TaxID=77586 RepID=A0A0D9V2V5_9ORYZ
MATKPIEIKFSSCRGVTFELKPSPASPFAVDSAAYNANPAQPPPTPPVVPTTGRSLASSHFCDLDVDGDDDDGLSVFNVHDEEIPVVVDEVVKEKKPNASSPARRQSRLAVILFDQGLFTVYKRLFFLCFALNTAAIALAAASHFPYAEQRAAVFAMGNILALTLCRSEAALRVVFWLTVALLGRPWVPVAAKTCVTALLQSLGGVHSGCGMSSVAWLSYALALARARRDTDTETVAVASAILALLALSCAAAFPLVRHLHHNAFERTHRFAGWSALALLWAFVLLSSSSSTGAAALAPGSRSPSHSSPSSRGSPIISDGRTTHSMLAGAVGDFTRGLVADPPTHLWVRGVRFAGLPHLISMYGRATMVATGSGICVFLSLVMQPSVATGLSLVWVAKGIEANYGEEIRAAVALGSTNLAGRVVVHDTAVMGRPNVTELAVGAARRWGAEVVVVTSNPEGSRDVVAGCRKAGIPAFGHIWDSCFNGHQVFRKEEKK